MAAALWPEPKGRGAVWADERGTSEEGRRRLISAPEASGKHCTVIHSLWMTVCTESQPCDSAARPAAPMILESCPRYVRKGLHDRGRSAPLGGEPHADDDEPEA